MPPLTGRSMRPGGHMSHHGNHTWSERTACRLLLVGSAISSMGLALVLSRAFLAGAIVFAIGLVFALPAWYVYRM